MSVKISCGRPQSNILVISKTIYIENIGIIQYSLKRNYVPFSRKFYLYKELLFGLKDRIKRFRIYVVDYSSVYELDSPDYDFHEAVMIMRTYIKETMETTFDELAFYMMMI